MSKKNPEPPAVFRPLRPDEKLKADPATKFVLDCFQRGDFLTVASKLRELDRENEQLGKRLRAAEDMIRLQSEGI